MEPLNHNSSASIHALRRLKRLLRTFRDLFGLPLGWVIFSLFGTTPAWAGQSLIRLFCVSAGQSNDLMSKLLSLRFPARKLQFGASVLPQISDKQILLMAQTIRDRGYYIYEELVPEDVCNKLMNFALTQPALVRPGDGQQKMQISSVYDPLNPLAVRYDFKVEDVIGNPEVQALMADPTLLSLAQAYLDAQPVSDVTGMWWHTSFSDQPDSEAAQFYHFDMDRIKWIKFFIYLTDVSSDNGPHCFIKGSHLTNGIPKELLSKGYARLSDEEVLRHYSKNDLMEFAAPRGTIIAEDTRGLHKGQLVKQGHRLVLQLQFSNSLFGPPYPKASFPALQNPQLASLIDRYPRIYSSYLPAVSQL